MKVTALLSGVMALLLGIGCGSHSLKTETPKPCAVPAWPISPTIEISPECAADAVCLTVASAVRLGEWIRSVMRYHEDAKTCPWLREATPIPLVDTTSALRAPTKQPDNSTAVFQEQFDVILDMMNRYDGVNIDLRWIPCGTLNSFYYPEQKTIYLCTEFAAYPEVAVFVAAHEMGHAIAMQLLNVSDEEAADEIAAMVMLETDRGYQLLEAALFFKAVGGDGIGSAGHPANNFRAWNLACLAAGSEGQPQKCVDLYRGTVARWTARLAKWRLDPK